MDMDIDIEDIIAFTLWAGVLASTALLAAGLVFIGLSGWQAAASGMISAGVILLLATPVLRVLLSILMFAMEKNKLYVVITVIVLMNLLIAIFVLPALLH